MPHRTSKIASLVICAAVAVAAVVLALDPLLFHGFAPACSDGYAEASGTAPCKPEWDSATPYLLTLGLAIVGVILSARSLNGGANGRDAERPQGAQ